MDKFEISIDRLTDYLETIMKEAEDLSSEFLNDELQVYLDSLKDIGGDLSECLKALKLVKTMASIPSKLFMHKFERFCQNISALPIEKRRAYMNKIGKERFNKESVYILNVINRIEETGKLDIFYKLFEARVEDEIDDDVFHRLVLKVDNTPLSDLIYMRNEICGNAFFIDCDKQESLVSSGWIIYAGMVVLTMDDKSNDGNAYRYTNSAKLFCKIVYGKEISNDNSCNGIAVRISG